MYLYWHCICMIIAEGNAGSAWNDIEARQARLSKLYTCKNAQMVTDLLVSCNKSVHQADIRMRSRCLFPVVWQIWNKLLASCIKHGLTISSDLLQVVPISLSIKLMSECVHTACPQLFNKSGTRLLSGSGKRFGWRFK